MLRLVSVTDEPINSRAEGISMIYAGMLKKHELTFYRHIHIIHTREKDQNLIIGEGKHIVNVKFSYDPGKEFSSKDDEYLQLTMIEIIHQALLMLATQDEHLDIAILYAIKAELIRTPLDFRVKYKTFTHPKDKTFLANVIVHPLTRYFNIYLELEKNDTIITSLLIYKGINVPTYFPDYFSKGKWLKNEFILSGSCTDMDIHLSFNDYTLTYVSTSGMEGSAPKFELMKAEAYRKKALEEYLHTLNPAIVAVLKSSEN
ncbi:hypothetical protein [Chitinophaga arvensicola]|uniref:Uncharacterized protein n=1 Tax=Chitinophaga arvensicola TaxID=29529 RepID=A0A1I0S5C0_9BACT|nr:hypothetical protein [Chitinophaga arvensicola]SEW49826.1 hypothetical protein SAMN04488122_3595 [Chitinophaga arvensicola]